jgi:hypothetical protein
VHLDVVAMSGANQYRVKPLELTDLLPALQGGWRRACPPVGRRAGFVGDEQQPHDLLGPRRERQGEDTMAELALSSGGITETDSGRGEFMAVDEPRAVEVMIQPVVRGLSDRQGTWRPAADALAHEDQWIMLPQVGSMGVIPVRRNRTRCARRPPAWPGDIDGE